VQSAGVLLQRPSPRYGHSQKQSIQPGFVKALADISAGGNQRQLPAGRRCGDSCQDISGLFPSPPAGEGNHIGYFLAQLPSQQFHMGGSFGQDELLKAGCAALSRPTGWDRFFEKIAVRSVQGRGAQESPSVFRFRG